MNELIKINNENKVDGHELHDFLQVETPFKKWIDRMIEYGFVEGTDFWTADKNVHRADGTIMPQKQTEYVLTISMAKEICMIQRNERGKQARLYFIECEKRLKAQAVPKIAPNPHYRTRMIKTAVKDISETADVIAKYFGVKAGMAQSAAMAMVGKAYGIDPEPLRQLLPNEEKPSYLTPTSIGEMLGGIRAKDVNIMLMNLGLQEKSGKGWMLTAKGKEFGESIPYTRNGHSGYQIQWCPEVVEYLR